MVSAGLFSLALHVALLFFVRFVPPALESLGGEPASLTVTLEQRGDRALNPADVPLASQDNAGEAKIGVQDKGALAPGVIASLSAAVGDQFRMEMPQGVTHEKILALDKPQPLKVEEPVASISEVQATQPMDAVPPAQAEERKASSAPLPSVARPVMAAEPAVEKLASSEPLHGERREKVALVEQPRDKAVPELPAPEQMSKPVEAVKQVAHEEPKPASAEEKKLSRIEEARPARNEVAKPARADEPKSLRAEASQPARAAESKAPSAVADGVKPEGAQAKLPGFEISGQPLPGIPLIKKIAAEEEKRHPPGERRKTISIKEQDFRYAMYIEGLRLKLERIGSLNYPAAAAGGLLSGTLSVKISIHADGSLENVSIVRPSKEEELNAGAEKIVRMSAPFSPLPEGIRREADILSVTIRWTFSRSKQSFD